MSTASKASKPASAPATKAARAAASDFAKLPQPPRMGDAEGFVREALVDRRTVACVEPSRDGLTIVLLVNGHRLQTTLDVVGAFKAIFG